MNHYDFLLAAERKYAIALAKYEVAEHPTETIVGLKALAEADIRIQAERKKLKAEMERIAGSIRRLCDPDWTPGHIQPLHLRKAPRRAGEASKMAYRIMREEQRALTSWELAHLVAKRLDVTDAAGIKRLAFAIHQALDRRTKAGQVIKTPSKPICWSIKPLGQRASSVSASVQPTP